MVYDELDLPWTALRIKKNGSAAGHNGVKSIIAALKTEVFTRVRVGIHPGRPVDDAVEVCARSFRAGNERGRGEVVSYTADAVESIIAEGAVKAMAKFNRRARGITRGRMRIYEELFIVRPDATDGRGGSAHRTVEERDRPCGRHAG